MCYNNKREARNRLALICVLPGQKSDFDFSFFSIFAHAYAHTELSETANFAHDIVYICMYISMYQYVNVYINIQYVCLCILYFTLWRFV